MNAKSLSAPPPTDCRFVGERQFNLAAFGGQGTRCTVAGSCAVRESGSVSKRPLTRLGSKWLR